MSFQFLEKGDLLALLPNDPALNSRTDKVKLDLFLIHTSYSTVQSVIWQMSYEILKFLLFISWDKMIRANKYFLNYIGKLWWFKCPAWSMLLHQEEIHSRGQKKTTFWLIQLQTFCARLNHLFQPTKGDIIQSFLKMLTKLERQHNDNLHSSHILWGFIYWTLFLI